MPPPPPPPPPAAAADAPARANRRGRKAPAAPARCATPDPDAPRHAIAIPPRFIRHPPAAAATISQARIGDWTLTPSAASFYAHSDGAGFPGMHSSLKTLAEAIDLGDQIYHPSFPGDYVDQLARAVTLLPLTEENTSDHYCLVLGDRLHGAVLMVKHDDCAHFAFNSLQSFFDAIARGLEIGLDRLENLPVEDPSPDLVDRFSELEGTPFIAKRIESRRAVAFQVQRTVVAWELRFRDNED